MCSRLIKKQFWTLSKRKAIGFIEGIANTSFIFKNDSIKFREISSNISNGNVIDVSLEKTDFEKNG